MNMLQGHGEHQDVGHQSGADFWVGIDSESGIESLPQTENNVGKAIEHDSSKHKGGEEDAMLTTTKHIPRDSCEGQNMTTRTVDASTFSKPVLM